MTGVLHTARINAIEVIVSSDKLVSSRSSVDRAPARCSGGHGSIPVGDSEFFFVPSSRHVD